MNTPDDRPAALVVGGGPAGLITAEVFASEGWDVTLLDHMPSVGRKLLLAGRGGLNITHGEPLERLLERYGDASAALEPAIRRWGPEELRAWCLGLGETTFVGSSGRVFPRSFRATPLLRAWLTRLAEAGVRIETRSRLVGLAGPHDVRVETPDGASSRSADAVVLALGGASWPRVGSDGGWCDLLREHGVAIAPFRPANCGLRIDWRKDFRTRHEGQPLKNVRVSIGTSTARGDAVITAGGLEGGPIYAIAATARDAIERDGACTVTIDLQPDRTVTQVADRLRRGRTGDSTSTALRRAVGLSPVAVAVVRELGGRHLPADPSTLAHLVKALPYTTSATMPIDRAISSAGGIAFDEIDERFMLRRLPGVFVAGEMLDWEAPTGGYLLQATFSTAVAAAHGAVDWHAATTEPADPQEATRR